MKKLFALVAVAALTLTACGSATDTNTESNTSTDAVVEDTTSMVEGKINVYTRDSSSGTREAYEKAVGFGQGGDDGEELTADAIEVTGNGDMAAKVGADLNGIGYVSLTTDFAANNLTPLVYEGVEASFDNVLNDTYGLKRPFMYVTRAEGDYEDERIAEIVEAFVVFLTQSIEGREVVDGKGGIVNVDEGTPWDDLKGDFPVLSQDNSDLTLKTGGSTSVEKTLTAALEAFAPLAGNVNFETNQTGSSDGFKRVLGEEKDGANAAHIGFASRPFKDSETVGEGFASGMYCWDAVVAVVNAENSNIQEISQSTLADIFMGNITTWEDVK